MKKTYMLVRTAKVDDEFKQMFATNTTFRTPEEACRWLHNEQKKNPEDKLIMLDEDMNIWQ